MKHVQLLVIPVIFFACQNPTTPAPTPTKISTSDSTAASKMTEENTTATPEEDERTYALTLVDFLRIRDTAGSKNTTVVATTREGSYLELTGKKSETTERITLRGKEHNEHWYQVDCEFGKGWVYGGAIQQVKTQNPIDKYLFATTVSLPEGWSDHYSEAISKKVKKAIIHFQNIKTASELIDFYTKELAVLKDSLQKNVYYGDYGTEEEAALGYFARHGLPFLHLNQSCGECSFEFSTFYPSFLAMAKRTPSDEDDKLFKLLVEIFGIDDAMHPSLTVHDCNFCWHVNLGNGEILKFTKKAVNELYRYPILQKKVLDFLILNMEGEYFMYTKDQVLKELYQINDLLKDIDWPEESQKKYQKIYDELTGKNHYTFDCNSKDCNTLVTKELFPDNQ